MGSTQLVVLKVLKAKYDNKHTEQEAAQFAFCSVRSHTRDAIHLRSDEEAL